MATRATFCANAFAALLLAAPLVAQSQKDVVAIRGRDTVFVERLSRDSNSLRSDIWSFGYLATHARYVAHLVNEAIDSLSYSEVSPRSQKFVVVGTYGDHSISEMESDSAWMRRIAVNTEVRAFPVSMISLGMIEQLLKKVRPIHGQSVSVLTYGIGGGDTSTVALRRQGDSVEIHGRHIGTLQLVLAADLSILGGTQALPGLNAPESRLTFSRRAATASPLTAAPWMANDPWSYRGFTVDMALLPPSKNREAVLAWLRKHIDIAADAKVDQSVQQFFRTIPLIIDSADASVRGGRYSSSTGRIAIGDFAGAIEDPSIRVQPMLLHELLHAYHDQQLPGGFGNRDVIRLFETARAGHAFADTSYMMRNVTEYFAMAGAVYLYGSAARDPLTRENLRNRQPALYEWLVTLFGPSVGSPGTEARIPDSLSTARLNDASRICRCRRRHAAGHG